MPHEAPDADVNHYIDRQADFIGTRAIACHKSSASFAKITLHSAKLAALTGKLQRTAFLIIQAVLKLWRWCACFDDQPRSGRNSASRSCKYCRV